MSCRQGVMACTCPNEAACKAAQRMTAVNMDWIEGQHPPCWASEPEALGASSIA